VPIHPGFEATVDAWGNLILEPEDSAPLTKGTAGSPRPTGE
jgi:hypothetical protein